MPLAFDRCRKAGGKVRTKQLSGNRYMHVCILNGKSYAGEIKNGKVDVSNVAKAIKGMKT